MILYLSKKHARVREESSQAVFRSHHEHPWTTVFGKMGLGYSSSSDHALNSTLNALFVGTNSTKRIMMLNIRDKELVVGDDLPPFDEFEWSEHQSIPSSELRFHAFPVFHLSICEVDLFGNYSTNWPTIIDTGATCLTLPGELFDSLMVWIPSECTGEISLRKCSLPKGMDPTRLPILTFSLSHHGNPVRIPLRHLVLNETGSPYCIVRGRNITSPRHDPYNMVIFGTLVMKSFETIFDMETQRIGFRDFNVVNESPPMDEQVEDEYKKYNAKYCAIPDTCVGEQLFSFRFNKCQSPPCNLYYFREINLDTQTCTYTLGFSLLVFLPLCICAFTDLLLYNLHIKFTKSIRKKVFSNE